VSTRRPGALRRRAFTASAILLASCGGETVPSGTGDPDPAPVLSPETRAALAALSPETLPPPPEDVSNAFADDPRAARFGQRLFFEKRFSGNLLDGDNDGSPNALGVFGETGKVACAGCHVPRAGFSDDRSLGGAISLGAGWGRRRSPSLLDVGQARLVMWDGRHDALYNQPFGPFESGVEMNSSRLFVAQQVLALHRAEYEAVFGEMPALDDETLFPQLTAETTGCRHVDNGNPPACDGEKHGMPGDGAEFDGLSSELQDQVTRVVVNVGKAIGAYERLLACGPGRFDAWVHGDESALSPSEQRGAALFVGKGRCVGCHAGPFFSDQAFHNVGLKPETVAVVFIDAGDRGAAAGLALARDDRLNVAGPFSDGDDGRLPATVTPAMEGAFRTPMLRCVDGRPAFMHTGQMSTLEEVVGFFDLGGHDGGFPGKSEIEPLGLDARERADLVAFLLALRGPGPEASLMRAPE
jgi:cytochrome c peroxidase